MNPSPLAGLDLHDILAAPAPDFWPPAPGWWVLAVLLPGLLFVLTRYLITFRRRRRRQARLLGELQALSTRRPDQVVTQVSMLLRRVALMCFDRPQVAPLTGQAWLAFLDRTGGHGAFVQGVGKVLATAPYVATHNVTASDNDALISLARQWIKQNLGRCA